MPYANNKGIDQPAYPLSLISVFVIRCLDSIIPLLAIAETSRIYLSIYIYCLNPVKRTFSVAEQAGLGLTRSETLKTGFLVTGLICILMQNRVMRQQKHAPIGYGKQAVNKT